MPVLEPLVTAAYNTNMPALAPLTPLPDMVLPAQPGPEVRVLRARPKVKPLTEAQQWELTEVMPGTDDLGEPAGDDEEKFDEDVTGDTTGDDPCDGWAMDLDDGDDAMEGPRPATSSQGQNPQDDEEEPTSPSVSQGSCGDWNIEPESGEGATVPAPKSGHRYVQLPIGGFNEHTGTDVSQRRRDKKGNWRYKPGQPQRAIQRATVAAAAGLPGARAFSFGCSCGMEYEVSFSMVMVAFLMFALLMFVLFKLAEYVREYPRKYVPETPIQMQEKLVPRVIICSDHPRSNHSYHVYESCYGLKNSKSGMVKAAEVCKICAKMFEKGDKHSK